jgi:hypothetical protein
VKNFLILLLFFYTTETYAQSPIAFNISCFVNSSAVASTSSLGNYSPIMREGAIFSYNQSRISYGSDEEFFNRLHQAENGRYNHPLGRYYGQSAQPYQERRFKGDYKDMQKWMEEEKKRLKQ